MIFSWPTWSSARASTSSSRPRALPSPVWNWFTMRGFVVFVQLRVERRDVGSQGSECDEVGRRRRIALDPNFAWRAVAAVCRDREALAAFVVDDDAEALEQRQRQIDVRPGNQLAFDLDVDRPARRKQRQRQQQRGEELARHVAAHPKRGVWQRETGAAVHAQWRKTALAQVIDAATESAQRVDEVADRALVHARHAAKFELAALRRREQRQRRGERPHGGSGVAEEKRGPLAAQPASQPPHAHGSRAESFHLAAQLLKGLEHDLGVVRIEQIVDRRRSARQTRQQQHAVRNALRARQTHRSAGGAKRGYVEETGRVHRLSG